MAGAFSGHLVDSYRASHARHSTPFTTPGSPIVTSGSMSFNPQMHGSTSFGNQATMADASFSFKSEPSFFDSGLSDATTHKIAALQAKLNQKLGPEYISQRPGPTGGPKLTYAEGWKIINLANEVFGFNGWSSNVVSLTTDFIDFNEETRRYTIGTTAIVRVTLRDGVFHEDIGYGMLENSKSKGQALDKCKKEAVTDGLKRALRNFGNLLGNCLYDKSYTQEVIKIKVPPPKFNKSELHRRPEFEERKPNIASTSASNPPPDVTPNVMTTPVKPSTVPPPKPLSAVPAHIRPARRASGSFGQNDGPIMNEATTPSMKGRAPAHTGLNTPIITPAHASTSSTSRQPQPPPPPPAAVALQEHTHKVSFAQATSTTSYVNNDPNTTADKPTTFTMVNSSKPSPPLLAEASPEPADADDSYHFYSDDDAFLALVDLGEGDLGQPIDGEDEEGFSESLISRREALGGEDTTFAEGGDMTGHEGHGNGVGVGPEAQDIQRGQGSSEGTSGLGMLSKLLPRNQQQTNRTAGPSNKHRPPHVVNQPPKNQLQHHHPQQNQNQHRQSNNHLPQNQNRPPAQMGSTTNLSSTTRRASTPSMGGFHFPPGVARPPPQGNRQSAISGPGSVIGLKRPLDVMSSSGMAQRRPGMGLDIHANNGAGQVKREVFAQLDVGEGGDVKRMRR